MKRKGKQPVLYLVERQTGRRWTPINQGDNHEMFNHRTARDLLREIRGLYPEENYRLAKYTRTAP